MRFSTLIMTLSAAVAVSAAPAAEPVNEVIRSLPSTGSYSGAEIVARLVAAGAAAPSSGNGALEGRQTQDPNICYANCILDGGSDWGCICECVACGGSTPAPSGAFKKN